MEVERDIHGWVAGIRPGTVYVCSCKRRSRRRSIVVLRGLEGVIAGVKLGLPQFRCNPAELAVDGRPVSDDAVMDLLRSAIDGDGYP